MQLETINKIFQYYLRFLGLSCYSPNCTVEYLLIAYQLLIICHELEHVYEIKYFEENVDEILPMSIFIALIEILLFVSYKITRIIICLRAIVWRKVEMKILQKLQEIEDDFQLKLFHHYESSSYFHSCLHKYFWLLDITWHILTIIFIWYYDDLKESLLTYRFTFTLQATRAIYLQFIWFIMKIDENLENLENCLKINLQRHQQLQQQQKLVKHSPEINNACIVMSVLSIFADNWPVRQIKPYLMQRIWIIKSIYGKIFKLSKTCSSYFGFSVLLMHFMCIMDFTELVYIILTIMDYGQFPLKTFVYGLYSVLPMLINLIVMCRCCEKCSKRVSKIM